jgi:hypothetical protein
MNSTYGLDNVNPVCHLMLPDSHLPIKLLASFVKRLSRLSLTASPPALVALIPFIYNIIYRHPQLMVMIHNTTKMWEGGEGNINHLQLPLTGFRSLQ